MTRRFTALFHSVSAFCNAGFSTFSNSIESYASSFPINITLAFLIVAGGIGFSVVYELARWLRSRIGAHAPFYRLSLHAWLVLRVSGFLILAGFLAVWLGGDWGDTGVNERFLSSLFQSVTTRTAGFNSIPLQSLAPWCVVILMMLMFIGGAPGGTAGGIKVSTVGVLFHSTRAQLKGRRCVEIHWRTIAGETVRAAFVISGLAALYIAAAVAALSWAEPDLPFLELVFEVVSAFGTVGLSLGVTAKLSTLGKLIVIVTMYLGRVGPLTVFLAMAGRRDEALYDYPQESIIVG